MNIPADDKTIAEVLSRYGRGLRSARRASHGLINATWIVTDTTGDTAVLQRLHPVVGHQVSARINALADRLAAHGLRSPRVIATADGTLETSLGAATWRLLTYIEGMTRDTLDAPATAAEAGGVLGRFHAALREPDALGSVPRSSVHDLPRHLDYLERMLEQHAAHGDFPAVEPVAADILRAAASLPPIPRTPPRLVHGDPKISNFLFDRDGRGLCLVDLDTIGLMPLALELGDALRSWCNPAGEDTERTAFSLPLLEGAVQGYAGVMRDLVTHEEIEGIVAATETIYVELAARFCADALAENYFGWDPGRFRSRSEHNLVRARGQLGAARALALSRDEAKRIVAAGFGVNP